MEFPVSGVEVSPIVPVIVGFCIALCTTPTGVSGAFLLLPFQFSVLNFTSPGVTPTNLLYNVFSTPGAIFSYRRLGAIDWSLIRAIFLGAGPGVMIGAVLRVTIFEKPASFQTFVGIVLLLLGANLVVQALIHHSEPRALGRHRNRSWISVLGAGAGMIGGIYGISGGSIIAPVLAGVFAIPVERVAPAALIATLLTSIAGVLSFEVLDVVGRGASDRGPDWILALLFAAGGAGGGFVGAHLNARFSEKWLRVMLGVLALALAISYVRPAVA